MFLYIYKYTFIYVPWFFLVRIISHNLFLVKKCYCYFDKKNSSVPEKSKHKAQQIKVYQLTFQLDSIPIKCQESNVRTTNAAELDPFASEHVSSNPIQLIDFFVYVIGSLRGRAKRRSFRWAFFRALSRSQVLDCIASSALTSHKSSFLRRPGSAAPLQSAWSLEPRTQSEPRVTFSSETAVSSSSAQDTAASTALSASANVGNNDDNYEEEYGEDGFEEESTSAPKQLDQSVCFVLNRESFALKYYCKHRIRFHLFNCKFVTTTCIFM